MKLQARFIQLPLHYDADLLAKEIGAMAEDAWLPHPQRFEGNDFLPLISVDGDPRNESFAGPMQPTEYLKRCPYLIDVLASLGASLGRTRLMRLSGGAEVTPHVDINYYWRDRMRVHVPIVTQPTVSFHCGGDQIHMAAGECWIFDTWSRHRVINDAERKRVHLVVDTVGGDGFWTLVMGARAPNQPNPNFRARHVGPSGTRVERLELETQNVPAVMTPWEAAVHLDFVLSEADPNQPGLQAVVEPIVRFKHVWRALWSSYGESEAGWPRYRVELDQLEADLRAANAGQLRLRNGSDLYAPVMALVINAALNGAKTDTGQGEQRIDVAQPVAPAVVAPAVARLPSEPDPVFDRPVFIVNPPRSGSSLLFETLAQAPGVYTIGGESHGVIEGVRGLGIYAQNLDSNCLDASHARPEQVEELRARFHSLLRDRDGARAPAGRVRMLEKTPKNALRIPFLAKAFPEARFIYLYRDPRQVLASMMEAWESGRFRTYNDLQGWRGQLPWSLLLTPGWRDLAGLPLNQVVAAQWAAATRVMLDSLDQIPADRWVGARYDALLADPTAEASRLCAAVGLDWDRQLGAELPIARHTVSKPRDDKWRARGSEIEAVLPGIAALIDRAASVAAH